mmetsp:Transcript_62202/g.111075  ORF Transcript_62202/g.111075 Transcript_62202/m.111075 type:complete len:1112 (-) Transcript_62202:124-3459(-)
MTSQAYGPGGFATASAPLPASSSLAAPVPSLPGSMSMMNPAYPAPPLTGPPAVGYATTPGVAGYDLPGMTAMLGIPPASAPVTMPLQSATMPAPANTVIASMPMTPPQTLPPEIGQTIVTNQVAMGPPPPQMPPVYGIPPPTPPAQTLPVQTMPTQTLPPQVLPPAQSMPALPGSQSMMMPGVMPGAQTMMPPGTPPRSDMMMPPGPVGPAYVTTASMTPPAPPPPPVVSMVGEPLPGEIIIEITRLLDMPVSESIFGGGLKQYRVRAHDEAGVYLDQTDELVGIPENPTALLEEEETETLRLGSEGILRFQTPAPVIFLTVEYAGGFTGNTRIGRCRIHRGDPRCKQVWPYTLSTRDGEPVGCGIELKVLDGGPPAMPMMPPPPMGMPGMPPPPMASMPPLGAPPPPTGTMGPSFHTMPPQELAAMMSQAGGPMSVEGPPGTLQTPSYRLQDPSELERIPPPQGTDAPLNRPPTLPMGTQQSFQTMSPAEMQRLGQQGQKPSYETVPPPMQSGKEAGADIVAYFELERVVDLVAPMGSTPFPGAKSGTTGEQVVVTLEPAGAAKSPNVQASLMESIRENPAQSQQLMSQIRRNEADLGVGKKELDRAGPFKSEMQGKLLRASCSPANLRVQVPFSDLAKGSTELRVVVWTQQARGKLVPAGTTAKMTVSWKPEPPKFYPILGAADKKMGGIYLSHRFARSADVPPPIKKSNDEVVPEAVQEIREDASAFSAHDRQGNYPKGSKEDILEQSAAALEAQNRALLQRIKENDPSWEPGQMAGDREWTVNGYRDWKDLDSLFICMGPNYVAKSDEVGCNICRVYEEDTSIVRELAEETGPTALGHAKNMEDKATKTQLINMMYKGSPEKIEASLRPVVSKSAKQLRKEGGVEGEQREKPKLHIKVKFATNLRSKDDLAIGTTGCKVIAEIPGKRTRWETGSIGNLVDPVWNEDGLLNDYYYGDDLVLKVVDQNWVVFTEHMGEVRLQAEDFQADGFSGTVNLMGSKYKSDLGKPTLSFDVKVINAAGSALNWPPDPPVYAPMTNLNPSDAETVRLANYDPIQCAKLPFADVNPNYCINQDIWGALGDAKKAEALLMSKPGSWHHKRVKDDCIMA